MNDDQLLRYSRQIMLSQIGIEGQERLHASRVMLVGLGGLGSPVAMYLAAAGVGELVLVDFDRVDLTNLQRQVIHGTGRIGMPKVESARQTLRELNPETRVEAIDRKLESEELRRQVAQADVVVDATDNFATRFALNSASVAGGKPLVSGAAIRMEAQVTVFPGTPGGPCYRCLYPEDGTVEETCSANGVLAPLVGIIGSLQAVEAIKLLTGAGRPLVGRLLLLDALNMEWRSLRLGPDPKCPVCGPNALTPPACP
jgi:adenylyltransferase/sulfurtransferase